MNQSPSLGSQIWIEPRQTPAQIEAWFALLAGASMPVARLFLMWNYLEPRAGVWDWMLYDAAFRAAEKHGVAIVATLTAHHAPAHRGFHYRTQGGTIIDTAARLDDAREYIRRVVTRFASSPALDAWMLMNEPGQPPAPDALALERFPLWLKVKYETIERLNAAWITNFADFNEIDFDARWTDGKLFTPPAPFVDWHTFWREHLTWQLGWTADEIRRHDAAHHIHVNPHALLDNLAANSLDLPEWRTILDSLGASIHPGWHFDLLERDDYASGVSYICDLVRGACEPKPFWVTELQGGMNLYSATRPLSPTREDIAQWTWTSIGAGAGRVIFWLLNARREGFEAGEWSMLDFQNRPSARFDVARDIAHCLNRHHELFAVARPIEAAVTILLSLDTMTLQKRFHQADNPARSATAHIRAALAYYKALASLGIAVNIKLTSDFIRDAPHEHAPRLVILPHVTVMTHELVRALRASIEAGSVALLSDLTAFYSPLAEFNFTPSSQLYDELTTLLGATLKEVFVIDERAPLDEQSITLNQPSLKLPARLWRGEIENIAAEIIGGEEDGQTTAARHTLGAGALVWIPSMISLAAGDDAAPLTALIDNLLATSAPSAFRFVEPSPHCVLRVMRSDAAYITIIANGDTTTKRVRLRHPRALQPQTLWATSDDDTFTPRDAETIVTLKARDTRVLLWQ